MSLNLSDALAIVLLMAAGRDRAFDRAAAKWIARLALERSLGLEDLRFALAALSAVPGYPEHAKRSLVELCARQRLSPVIGLPASSDHAGGATG